MPLQTWAVMGYISCILSKKFQIQKCHLPTSTNEVKTQLKIRTQVTHLAFLHSALATCVWEMYLVSNIHNCYVA